MNRKIYYKGNNRKDIQYKISVLPITKNLDKEQQKYRLKPEVYLPILNEINFSSKIKQKNVIDLLSSNIFNVGLINDSSKSLTKENVKKSDFLFFDFEDTKDETEKEILTFDKCLQILEENNLNYILKTSYNYSEKEPRLHLFLPTLFPIRNDDEYKYNLEIIRNKYFSKYSNDIKTKNINRWIFSSNSNTLRFEYNFDNDDIELEKIDEKLLSIQSKQTVKKQQIKNQYVELFSKQVESMYRFKYARTDDNNVIKYFRDSEDKIPNIWYSINYYDNLDSYTIFDNKNKCNVLFSYEDFEKSQNPQNIRLDIQQNLKSEMNNWFFDGGKNYFITNEGLGKSESILNFGQYHNFIYVCHSLNRIDEISKRLDEKGIKYKKILGNQSILEKWDSSLSEKYTQSFKNDTNENFKKFVEKNINDEDMKKSILDFHKENIDSLLLDDCIRLVTSKKLSIVLKNSNFTSNNNSIFNKEQKIVFDEFIFGEWAIFRSSKSKYSLEFDTIWNKDTSIFLEKNEESFLELLKYQQNVLILTTERYMIKPLFYKTEYSEIFFTDCSKKLNNDSIIDYIKFEKKLYDDSIIYILTKSTNVNIRDNLISTIKDWFMDTYKEDIDVISDNSSQRDYSHLSVKGSNEHQDKNLLIIGTLRAEIEDNIFYYSCEEYFKGFSQKKIQNLIKSIHLQSQVSQSIGRNSGFRNKNKRTVIVLPLLNGNSKNVFKPIDLNYVSPNVFISLDINKNLDNKMLEI